jgi:flagellar basal body P-ring protein FlgI
MIRKLSVAFILSVFLFTTCYAKVKTITLTINQPDIENCITAIDNQFTDCQFKVFPNPGSGMFTIEINNSSPAKDAMILVHDVSGKVISNNKIKISSYSIKRIDLSTKPRGTYILNIISDTKEKYSAELIIF